MTPASHWFPLITTFYHIIQGFFVKCKRFWDIAPTNSCFDGVLNDFDCQKGEQSQVRKRLNNENDSQSSNQ